MLDPGRAEIFGEKEKDSPCVLCKDYHIYIWEEREEQVLVYHLNSYENTTWSAQSFSNMQLLSE